MQTQRRGRPRSARPERDLGTPELQLKRKSHLTSEIIDIYLEKRIISQKQHWCCIHLRWLYTLKYGSPNVKAVDPAYPGGVDIATDDPEWRSLREEELRIALEMLKKVGFDQLILDMAVYNIPLGLENTKKNNNMEKYMLYNNLHDALEILTNLWCN